MADDYFALLDLPRKAALDVEAVKQAFFAKTRDAADASELNHAFEILSAPEKRLKHLLELLAGDEAKAWRVVTMDESLMSVFEKLGPFLQTVAEFEKKRSAAVSALARALLAADQARLAEMAEGFTEKLVSLRSALNETLPALDARIESGDATALRDIHAAQARHAYLAKWQAQVREAFMALA